MRIAFALLFVLVITAPATAGHVTTGNDGQIVPGERIGPARLGMTSAEIEAVNAETLCPVVATYDLSGAATRLVTDWGGGCRVSGEVQVGVSFAPALEAFGRPDHIVEDRRYPDATAYWVTYGGWGIAFHILVIREASALIQAIAIFRGTAVVASRPHLPLAEPWK